MIHGMWGGPWYWEKYQKFFEERGYQCIPVSLLLHRHDLDVGELEKLGRTGLLEMADDVAKKIDGLDEKPVLMGHSMGALIAQILVSRGLAKSAVLLTPAAPSGILSIRPSVVRSFFSVMTVWAFWKRPMKQRKNEAIYSMLHKLPQEEQIQTYDKFVYESGRAASEIGLWLFDVRRASKVDSSQVTCPVFVVGAGEDRITPASVVRKVAKKYKAEYREFPNNAHWVVAEPGWEKIAQESFDWLETLCLV